VTESVPVRYQLRVKQRTKVVEFAARHGIKPGSRWPYRRQVFAIGISGRAGRGRTARSNAATGLTRKSFGRVMTSSRWTKQKGRWVRGSTPTITAAFR